MMAFAGQIPAIRVADGEHVLMLGMIDPVDVLCIIEDGTLVPISLYELRSSWFYDAEISIWDTSQPTIEDIIDASKARESEDVPEGLPEADGAGDGDPAGGRGGGEVDADEGEDEDE